MTKHEAPLSIAVPSLAKIDIDWEERSPLQGHDIGWVSDVEMAPASPCPAGPIEIDWEEHLPLQFAASPQEEARRRVRFHKEVSIILAPSREDIKASQCNLWWKKQDYLLFQQSSYKEVKLYSVFHALSFKDARRQLYQTLGDTDDFLGCVHPAKGETDEPDEVSEAVAYVEEAYGCCSAIADEEIRDDDNPLFLYIPSPTPGQLRTEEHGRHDYYNKYHSLLSRIFWLSAGGLLTIASMTSFITPLLGYYILTILSVSFLGDIV